MVFTETVNWKKHDTVNVFPSEMVTVNVFYNEMVNWEKQDMVFQNHGHELNYGNLILKDKIIW